MTVSEDQGRNEFEDVDRVLGEMGPVEAAAFDDARRRTVLLRELVNWRNGRGLTQREVAEAMDTTQSAVSELEKGRIDPRLSTLQRYARALGAELDVQLGDDGGLRGAELDEHDLSSAAEIRVGRILKALHQAQGTHGSRTAARLVEQTGLPEAVVGKTLIRLSTDEWIREVGDSPALVALNADRALVVGVSIRGDHVRGVITNLRTEMPLEVKERPLPSGEPGAVVGVVKSLVESLIEARAADQRIVLGLGVEIPGLVDNDADLGYVLFAPELEPRSPLWRNFALKGELQAATGLRTVVENDADALAVYEYLRRGDVSDLAVVLMSEDYEGIGCGLIYDGRLLGGRRGISGEIGHVPVGPGGGTCRLGHEHGCLETVASAAAIVRRVVPEQRFGDLQSGLTEVSNRVQRRDRAAVEAFQRAGQEIGRVLTTLTSILAPALVVIYGQPEFVEEQRFESARLFVDAIKNCLVQGWFTKHDLKPYIVTRELDRTAGPRGAASVAVSHFLDQPLRWLSGPGTSGDGLNERLLARSR